MKEKTEKNNTFSTSKINTNINNIQREKKQNNKKLKTRRVITILTKNVLNHLWLSIAEAANLGGVTTKTIRRAIQSQKIIYKIVKNKYMVDFSSIILYLYSNKKLKNKLEQYGIGQYIEKWRE